MISGLVRNETHCLTLVEDGRRWVDNNWGGILFLLQPGAMITLKLNTLLCCFKMSLTVSCKAILQRPVDGRECALRNLMASKVFLGKIESGLQCSTQCCDNVILKYSQLTEAGAPRTLG